MHIRRYSNAKLFLQHAEAWLLQAEAEHNLILGIAYSLLEDPARYDQPLYFAVVEDQGQVVGCAFRTPPYKLGLTRMPSEALHLLVDDVSDVYPRIPAVLGPEAEAKVFSELWSKKRAASFRAGMKQRIYQLERVAQPEHPAPGRLRVALPGDAGFLVPWLRDMIEESGVQGTDAGRSVDRGIRNGTLYLWEDGEPVSMAGWPARTPHGVRIGYVYTPPELRGRGYASNCVGALSQKLLDQGFEFCFLYTNLSNPTSNSIYTRLGYRPVCDVIDFHFEESK